MSKAISGMDYYVQTIKFANLTGLLAGGSGPYLSARIEQGINYISLNFLIQLKNHEKKDRPVSGLQ